MPVLSAQSLSTYCQGADDGNKFLLAVNTLSTVLMLDGVIF